MSRVAVRRSRRCAHVLLVSLIALTMASCGGWTDQEPSSDPPTGGPLVVGGGYGGHVVLPAAQHGGGKAVFGGLLLCTSNGEPATIRAVTFDSEVSSASVRGVLRKIPPTAERNDDPESISWNPIIALRGDLDGRRVRRQMQGDVLDEVEGQVVDDECGPRRPGEALTELLVAVEAGRPGASVRAETVEYEAGGREYSVRVRWWFVICGDEVADDSCSSM